MSYSKHSMFKVRTPRFKSIIKEPVAVPKITQVEWSKMWSEPKIESSKC